MAEGFVNVTEGSGKKLHTFDRTIGANSVHDEVTLQGEPYLSSYIAASTAGSVSTVTAASHLFQIMAGASLNVRIRRIEMHQIQAVTTATIMDTRLFRLTTAGTGGTVQNVNPMQPGDPAAGCTAMSLPTAKGAEGTLIAIAAPYMIQTIGASTPFINPVLVWDFDRPRTKPLIISNGTANGIAVKNQAAVANGLVQFIVWLDETSF